jgi:hypothetical protein
MLLQAQIKVRNSKLSLSCWSLDRFRTNINAGYKIGQTPLRAPAREESFEIIEVLLIKEAELSQKIDYDLDLTN